MAEDKKPEGKRKLVSRRGFLIGGGAADGDEHRDEEDIGIRRRQRCLQARGTAATVVLEGRLEIEGGALQLPQPLLQLQPLRSQLPGHLAEGEAQPHDLGRASKRHAGLLTADPGSGVSLLAYHGAPDAPTVDVNALNVGTLVPGLQFGAFAGYLSVPAADYVLQVTPAGQPDQVVVSFSAPLSGLGGGAALVFASGFLTEGAGAEFGLFAALSDGTVIQLAPTTVATEHSSWGSMKAQYAGR